MRQPSRVTIALAALLPILLSLTTPFATVPDSWKPWLPSVAWPATVLLILVIVLIEVSKPPPPPPKQPAVESVLEKAAGDLAVAVGIKWRSEEEQWRVQDPIPLPVRWSLAPENLTDHLLNIERAPAGAPANPLTLVGKFDEIAEVYQRIRSRRLIVLGSPGSGKTTLALRFVFDLLKTRTKSDPVPVLFGVGSWNPTKSSLRNWLADRLIRDYAGMGEPSPILGRSLAAALLDTGRILPVLDGFDEITGGLRHDALEALNATPTMPLLMTSRLGEYEAAVGVTRTLKHAAGIQLVKLDPADLATYLPRTIRKEITNNGQITTAWEPVLKNLHSFPDSPLANVLSTPLMVVLAGVIYSKTADKKPNELLDADIYKT